MFTYQQLLRQELGFNGLIISDASHMIGMAGVMERKKVVPLCIAAGCDMFLFANDFEEDLGYLRAGYDSGVVTDSRLSDALHRVLGLKAHLKLYDESVLYPDQSLLQEVGCAQFRSYTDEAADRGVTLVKDTRSLLPLDPKEKNRALLIYVRSTPNSKGDRGDGVRERITAELERVDFRASLCLSFYDRENAEGVNPMNFLRMMMMERREDFKKKYDVVFVFVNVKGYAQRNVERLSWSSGLRRWRIAPCSRACAPSTPARLRPATCPTTTSARIPPSCGGRPGSCPFTIPSGA